MCLRIDNHGNILGTRENTEISWTLPTLTSSKMERLSNMRFKTTPDESYSLDGTMTGSMPCDMGCLPEILPERKKKAPVKLFKKVAKSFHRESDSNPPHIQLQVVKIFISRAIPQDMLAVVFEATV